MDCNFKINAKGLWRCSQCNWIYKLKSGRPPRRNCPKSPDLRPAAEKLGIEWKDVVHYSQALARWTVAGFPVRSQEEIKRIYEEHCRSCEHYVNSRCKLCHCNVNKSRFALVNKIKMKTEACAIGLWGESKNYE